MAPLPGDPRPSRDGCGPWRARVSDYVDGSLDGRERERMTAHLGACPPCRAEVDLETRLRAQMRAERPGPPPLALSDRLMSIGGDPGATPWLAGSADNVLPSERRRRRRATVVTLGTMMAALTVLLGVGWSMAPSLPRVNTARGMAVEQAGLAVPSAASADPHVCPARFTCPERLAGLPLVGVTVSSDAVLLLYASGGSVLAVVEQWGVLDDSAARMQDPTVACLAWQSGETVYAVSASSLLLATAAESQLPHAPIPRLSPAQRIARGLERLAGR